ncbi:MAG: pca operon transcription factor PcaQ [Hyphomicrobiales bacterium]|nr:pca operon transcription factor PcaQ [Hyphomicrobiales bacterium]
MDPRIRLRHIRCFLEVAHNRSLARAADALAISQPAVTKTLQELECILEAPLVERSRKGAILTRYGEAFMSRASIAMLELENAVESVSDIRRKSAWTVRIGALPTVAARIMPEAINRFKKQENEAVLRIVSGPNTYLISLLKNDALDLVVGRLGATGLMTDLTFTQLYSEPVRFVVRPGHPLLEAETAVHSRLADYPAIIPDEDAVIRSSVDRLLISLGFSSLPNRIESVSTSFGRAYTSQTDAIWIISHGVVSRELEAGTLVALDIDTSDTSGPVGLTTRADASTYPGMEALKLAIRQAAEEVRSALE